MSNPNPYDKLIIKSLRTAVFAAWLMITIQIANVIITTTRSCPRCPSCSVPAEKPAP